MATLIVEEATVASARVGFGAALQVGGLVAPLGPPLTAQARLTVPVKPPLGLTARLSVPVLPGLTLTVPDAGVMEKPGGAVLTGAITSRPSVCTNLPVESVPVTRRL